MRAIILGLDEFAKTRAVLLRVAAAIFGTASLNE
jgi:hypothetical protein